MNVELQGGPFDGKRLDIHEMTTFLRMPISRQLHWCEDNTAITKMQIAIALYSMIDGNFVYTGMDSLD